MESLLEIRWIPDVGLLVRIGVAALLGACVGLERELTEHPAGLRTHMLVAVAAALSTVVAIDLAARLEQPGTGYGVDPLRAIEAVTAGVAFVAAGAIIRAGDKIRNLTTGAGLWTVGAIGLACGAGYIGLAVVATLAALVILTLVSWLEKRL
jgi:putative Mg2+ transporter-C (MgtC) family protein